MSKPFSKMLPTESTSENSLDNRSDPSTLEVDVKEVASLGMCLKRCPSQKDLRLAGRSDDLEAVDDDGNDIQETVVALPNASSLDTEGCENNKRSAVPQSIQVDMGDSTTDSGDESADEESENFVK
ncbi:uncharacterized protein LOC119662279 [Teleopsis dalmanni]|uniref:uncharacterized protein LOC119662279 n=1 Tax=Teleopsis dalmanni TaxID=139649 RepID=UPI0018CF37E2|nr:uncharacterized protein LOC119662279 [Teleopsis dalmanni]